jgi:hypothetical protein
MGNRNRKFWIGVASKDHVANGVKLVCQFCHGKSAPVKRLYNDLLEIDQASFEIIATHMLGYNRLESE